MSPLRICWLMSAVLLAQVIQSFTLPEKYNYDTLVKRQSPQPETRRLLIRLRDPEPQRIMTRSKNSEPLKILARPQDPEQKRFLIKSRDPEIRQIRITSRDPQNQQKNRILLVQRRPSSTLKPSLSKSLPSRPLSSKSLPSKSSPPLTLPSNPLSMFVGPIKAVTKFFQTMIMPPINKQNLSSVILPLVNVEIPMSFSLHSTKHIPKTNPKHNFCDPNTTPNLCNSNITPYPCDPNTTPNRCGPNIIPPCDQNTPNTPNPCNLNTSPGSSCIPSNCINPPATTSEVEKNNIICMLVRYLNMSYTNINDNLKYCLQPPVTGGTPSEPCNTTTTIPPPTPTTMGSTTGTEKTSNGPCSTTTSTVSPPTYTTVTTPIPTTKCPPSETDGTTTDPCSTTTTQSPPSKIKCFTSETGGTTQGPCSTTPSTITIQTSTSSSFTQLTERTSSDPCSTTPSNTENPWTPVEPTPPCPVTPTRKIIKPCLSHILLPILKPCIPHHSRTTYDLPVARHPYHFIKLHQSGHVPR